MIRDLLHLCNIVEHLLIATWWVLHSRASKIQTLQKVRTVKNAWEAWQQQNWFCTYLKRKPENNMMMVGRYVDIWHTLRPQTTLLTYSGAYLAYGSNELTKWFSFRLYFGLNIFSVVGICFLCSHMYTKPVFIISN